MIEHTDFIIYFCLSNGEGSGFRTNPKATPPEGDIRGIPWKRNRQNIPLRNKKNISFRFFFGAGGPGNGRPTTGEARKGKGDGHNLAGGHGQV